MILPEEYVAQKFYLYCGGVKYNRQQKNYQGSCSICREGSSWLKKKRCYYLPQRNIICCHNCGWLGNPITWIKEVAGLSYNEIVAESKDYDILPIQYKETSKAPQIISETLPHDSINLFDRQQVQFYYTISSVLGAIRFVNQRLLSKAKYKPSNLYFSLSDKIHHNRVVLPFYDDSNKIIFYQTRSIVDDGKPKYLSKIGSEKSLFNYNQIDASFDNIFIFEGPINACFCKNGVAVAGIQENSDKTFTPLQNEQIRKYPLHKKIWVLDSQWVDNASLIKTEKLINIGESVFIWPKDLGQKYKDFNDIAIDQQKNEIDYKVILDNTYSQFSAKIKLYDLKRSRI